MNGRSFVFALAAVALIAAVAIVLGAPKGEPQPPADEAVSTAPSPGVGGHPAAPRAEPGLETPVDGASTTSADTAAAWSYHRAGVADLDGDGVPERLVIASDVFVTDDGEPVWEDEQRWAVYVEEDDGSRTLVYSGRAAPGAVSVAVGALPETPGARNVAVIEQGASRARLLLVAYDGPGRSRVLDAAGTPVDAWVDQVAEERR